MPLDPIPASSQSGGRWKIAFVPADEGIDPLSVADIIAEGTNVTYSFTPDGFNRTLTQTTITDPRLTLEQDLSRPGKATEALAVRYVESQDPDSANILLTQGTAGYFVIRRGIANDVEWAVGQKVDVISFEAGIQRPAAPTDNGMDLIDSDMFITDATKRNVTLVA